ncbi:MAG: SCP2 sterol-binding domain-containing protein [Actinomycetota bacterium]
MATKKEVEAKLREMVRRLAGSGEDVQANLARALPDPRMIQIDVTDLDASYWTQLADGRMSTMKPGAAPEVDIRLRASSDDLVAMVDGELGLLKSYLSGRIRIDASLSDLLALRKMA